MDELEVQPRAVAPADGLPVQGGWQREGDGEEAARAGAAAAGAIASIAALPMISFPLTVTERSLSEFLLKAVELDGISDLLVQSGDYVFIKQHNRQRVLSNRRVEAEEVEQVAAILYGRSAMSKVNGGEGLDFRAEINRTINHQVSFRGNATRCRVGDISDGLSVTLRYVTDVPRPLESLGLEDEILDNLFFQYGLCLVVGTTGSGKSTILSSANRYRLEHRKHDPVKIVTFEDPIEYTYQLMGLGVMPLVSQVEIGHGRHLNTFEQAGPNAMRRGGDVYVLGEMRDRDSVNAAFELAMTGHAVYATLHVESPAEVFERVVSFFPVDAQPAAASKLRSVLRMIIAQKQFQNTAGKSERVRSWCVMDQEVKRRLSVLEHHHWENEIGAICRERKADYGSRVIEILRAGRISFERFRNITGYTRAEALAYCREHGIDASDLD